MRNKILSLPLLVASGLSTIAPAASAQTPATDFTKAAESTVNGVVSIKSYATPRSSFNHGGGDFFSDPFYEFFFGAPQQRREPSSREREQRQTGLGSGVILSKDGYIVTNNHVIEGADRLEVTLNDNQTFNATVVGSDPTTDVALIKIDADDLHVIPMGDSETLKVGEWVLAVGNPFGFTSTVTTGIVSAKGRNISSITRGASKGIESYIQTDAAVNPGNSGGALVNLKGELVGINTAIYSQTGNYAGYSFAIPTSIVKKIVADIKDYGEVQRAYLGVTFGELTPEIIKEKDITAVKSGLYIASVQDRSAAFEAGLEEGDIITAINGTPTHNTADLQEAMAKLRPGDKVTVEFYRDNKRNTASATLRNASGNTSITKTSDWTSALGCAFKKLSAETRRQLEISSGVQVSGLRDGRFKDAGIKDGFIIQSINDIKVNSADDIEKIYNKIVKSHDTEKVMFISGLYPTGRKFYYAVDISE